MKVHPDLLEIFDADERAQQDVAAVQARLAAERRDAEAAAAASQEAARVAARRDLDATVDGIERQAFGRHAERERRRAATRDSRRRAADARHASAVAAFVAIVCGETRKGAG
jgi:hypothetical protein